MIAAWSRRTQTQRASGLMFLGTTTPVLLLYALTVAVIPDERMDNSLARALFDTPNIMRLPRTFFHRNLDLAEGVFVTGEPSSEIVAALRSSDEKEQAEARKKILGINLAGRDLRFANLSQATLPAADLRGAHLQGVTLVNTHLQGAFLQGAHLQGVTLRFAHLQGANLYNAHLQGASLYGAHLQGASLVNAHLQGTILQGAHLQGADLQGAILSFVGLQGANLYTDRQSVILQGADLQGADLQGADLQGADLQGANLQGANLQNTKLQGADLTNIKIEELSQKDFNAWKAKIPESRQTAVAKRIGQPAQIKSAKIKDAWCDDALRLKVKGCLAATERPAYEDRLVSRLVALSCEDVSIVRGIIDRDFLSRFGAFSSAFALGIMRYQIAGYPPSAFSRNLATALFAKADQPDCKGVRELSQNEKDRLKETVKRYDEQEKKKAEQLQEDGMDAAW